MGPEGHSWPRLDHDAPNRCGTVLLPEVVRDQFLEDAQATPDGRLWPKPTQILMEPGDCVIALFHVPHCATRNESPQDRVNVYFKLRAKKRQPNRVVVGGGGVAGGWFDRGPKGELLSSEDGEVWQRTKDALCDMWSEWAGMAAVVAEQQAEVASSKL